MPATMDFWELRVAALLDGTKRKKRAQMQKDKTNQTNPEPRRGEEHL